MKDGLDLTKACIAACKSGRFETGEGTCAPICMQFLGNPRAGRCGSAEQVHGPFIKVVVGEQLFALTRDAFKAGWRTNAIQNHECGESYLEGCEQTDWLEYQRRGLLDYLSVLSEQEHDK